MIILDNVILCRLTKLLEDLNGIKFPVCSVNSAISSKCCQELAQQPVTTDRLYRYTISPFSHNLRTQDWPDVCEKPMKCSQKYMRRAKAIKKVQCLSFCSPLGSQGFIPSTQWLARPDQSWLGWSRNDQHQSAIQILKAATVMVRQLGRLLGSAVQR